MKPHGTALTGNGFPAPLYTLFKILWYREHEAELYRAARSVIGTKDYINLRLTGTVATDFSYASGCGAYNLEGWGYAEEVIAAAGLNPSSSPPSQPPTRSLAR